eukprot:3209479-Rhodomonas_salina.2
MSHEHGMRHKYIVKVTNATSAIANISNHSSALRNQTRAVQKCAEIAEIVVSGAVDFKCFASTLQIS